MLANATLKGYFTQKWKFSQFTHPEVVVFSSAEHKRWYFEECR